MFNKILLVIVSSQAPAIIRRDSSVYDDERAPSQTESF